MGTAVAAAPFSTVGGTLVTMTVATAAAIASSIDQIVL
jgi:hypothetical protein